MIGLQVRGRMPLSCMARIDTGCPVTLVQESLISCKEIRVAGQEWNRYRGINNSKLQVRGIVKATITMDGCSKTVTVRVVPDRTMTVPLLIGRNTLRLFNYRLTNSPDFDKAVSEILLIGNDFRSL